MISEKDKKDKNLYNFFEMVKVEALESILDEEIQNRYERYLWLKEMNIDPNEIHLEESHNEILDIFDRYNQMLNENGIEYYYTSGILSYLLVDKELERYHHDLDIFINMKDLEKLESISGLYGFSFERKLGKRNDGTNRIMLKMKYENHNDIPITVFMYVREKDGSITQNDYYIGENGEHLVERMYNSKEIVDLSFSNEPKIHNDINYYAITLEALYLSKKGNRPKDIYDCKIFEKNIDYEKLEALEEAFKYNKNNIIERAEEDTYYNFVFKDEMEKGKVLVRC